MAHPLVEEATIELERAQSQLDTALRAWDASVSELWRTSIVLTQAQRRVTHAHELLRDALDAVREARELSARTEARELSAPTRASTAASPE